MFAGLKVLQPARVTHLNPPMRGATGQPFTIKQEQGVDPGFETPNGHTDSFGNFVDSTTNRPTPPLSGQEYCEPGGHFTLITQLTVTFLKIRTK